MNYALVAVIAAPAGFVTACIVRIVMHLGDIAHSLRQIAGQGYSRFAPTRPHGTALALACKCGECYPQLLEHQRNQRRGLRAEGGD